MDMDSTQKLPKITGVCSPLDRVRVYRLLVKQGMKSEEIERLEMVVDHHSIRLVSDNPLEEKRIFFQYLSSSPVSPAKHISPSCFFLLWIGYVLVFFFHPLFFLSLVFPLIFLFLLVFCT